MILFLLIFSNNIIFYMNHFVNKEKIHINKIPISMCRICICYNMLSIYLPITKCHICHSHICTKCIYVINNQEEIYNNISTQYNPIPQQSSIICVYNDVVQPPFYTVINMNRVSCTPQCFSKFKTYNNLIEICWHENKMSIIKYDTNKCLRELDYIDLNIWGNMKDWKEMCKMKILNKFLISDVVGIIMEYIIYIV